MALDKAGVRYTVRGLYIHAKRLKSPLFAASNTRLSLLMPCYLPQIAVSGSSERSLRPIQTDSRSCPRPLGKVSIFIVLRALRQAHAHVGNLFFAICLPSIKGGRTGSFDRDAHQATRRAGQRNCKPSRQIGFPKLSGQPSRVGSGRMRREFKQPIRPLGERASVGRIDVRRRARTPDTSVIEFLRRLRRWVLDSAFRSRSPPV